MTDTCARCGLTIGYNCGCTEIERLTAERDRYKARAERAERALGGVVANSTDSKARFIATETLAQIDAEPAGVSELVGVKVRPLVWDIRYSREQVGASGLFGNIYVSRFGGKWFYKSECFGDDLEAAKNAAQADYDQRILAALEPGQTLADAYRAGLEAAATRVNEMSHMATEAGDFEQASRLANEAENIRALPVPPEIGGE